MFAIMQNNVLYSFVSLLLRLDYKTSYTKIESSNNTNLVHSSLGKNSSESKKISNTNKNSQKRNRKSKKKRRK